jgi:hypothetical protein
LSFAHFAKQHPLPEAPSVNLGWSRPTKVHLSCRFAIDSLQEAGYYFAAPQGVNGKRYLKNSSQQLATGN